MLRQEEIIIGQWRGGFDSPLASVCMRTYNLEKYVSQAIESILNQVTMFPYEIVIDDDNSTDGTQHIIGQYVEKYPRIIKANFHKKNMGTRRNFVRNLQNAKGKYIAPCDGDDYWTDILKLQKQVDFLEQNKQYAITYCPLDVLLEDGTIRKNLYNDRDLEVEQVQKYSLGTGICAACFRNVDIIKDYPVEYHCAPIDDMFLWPLIGAYGKAKYLPDISPSVYRYHSRGDFQGLSSPQRNKNIYLTFLALSIYFLRSNNLPLYRHFHKKAIRKSLVLHNRFYYIYNALVFEKNIKALRRMKKIFKGYIKTEISQKIKFIDNLRWVRWKYLNKKMRL
jgi:glycosyltransferase involved in cell wall biosynthesis